MYVLLLMIGNLENINFTHEFLNIHDYLSNSTLKRTYINLDNSSKKQKLTTESISYCIISCSEYQKIIDLLDYISDYLENGAIILFCGWFDNIVEKGKGIRDAVSEWLNDHELVELIDFPINSWREKAYIFRRNKIEYVNWSD